MIPRRSGMTLVEVVSAMGANAVLAGVAVVALVSLGRADRDVNARLDESLSLAHLAERLRADVHAAETLEWNEQQRVLRLRLNVGLGLNGEGEAPAEPGSGSRRSARREPRPPELEGDAIEYRADESQWSRYTVDSGDETEAELSSAFRLPKSLELKFDPVKAKAGEIVRVRLQSRATPENVTDRPRAEELLIEVGRDARLLHE
jgi:hypothetical protein